MATEDLFIVAIELGSSNVTGIAGKKMPDGTISIQAVVQEPSSMFIRRGVVFNLKKSAQCIVSIKERLEERIKRKITQVYVGYGGQSIHSVFNTISKSLNTEEPISKEVVEELENENILSNNDKYAILDVIPQGYIIGNETSSDPIGIIADSIEAKYMNIIARPSLKSNIESCFNEAGLHIAGCIITPISEAFSQLTEPEKRSGCVFVDFGADTTSVVIFKDNILRYIAVIPLGSSNITKDIESCLLEEQEAESLKRRFGSAVNKIEIIEEGKEAIYSFPDETCLTKLKFSEIVEARMREILVNVANQIKVSKMEKSSLIGGAVLAGGGSNLKNLIEAFKKATGITQVRFCKDLPHVTFAKNIGVKTTECSYISTISILEEGTQNCCGQDFSEKPDSKIFQSPDEEEPTTEDNTENGEEANPKKGPKSSFIKKWKEKLENLGTAIVGEEE